MGKKVAPDRGYAWVVLAASLGCNCLTGLVVYFVGIIHVELLNKFRSDVTITSWAGSLYSSLQMIAAPLASWVVHRYSCRVSVILGGVLLCVGFVTSAFVTSILQLLFTYGLIAGTGLALTYSPSLMVITFYFHKYRSLASSISVSGCAVGMLTGSLLAQTLIDTYGLTGAFLIIGGLCLQNCVFGMLFRPTHYEGKGSEPQTLPSRNLDQSSSNDLDKEEESSKDVDRGQESSKDVDRGQESSKDVDRGQKSSKDLDRGQESSKDVDRGQESSKDVDRGQESSKDVDRGQKSSKDVDRGQESFKDVDRGQKSSKDVDRGQKSSKDLDRGQESSKDLDRGQESSKDVDRRQESSKDVDRGQETSKDVDRGQESSNYLDSGCGIEQIEVYVTKSYDCLVPKETVERSSLSKFLDNFTAIRALIKNWPFLFHCAGFFFQGLNISGVFLHLPEYAITNGTSVTKAAALFVAVGIFSLVSRILSGILLSSERVRGLVLSVVLAEMSCLTCCLFFFYSSTYVGQMAFSSLYGLSTGGLFTLINVLTVQLVEVEFLTTAYGVLIFMMGVGYVVGPPLAALIVDYGGTYGHSFLFLGLAMFASGVCDALALLMFQKRRRQFQMEVNIGTAQRETE